MSTATVNNKLIEARGQMSQEEVAQKIGVTRAAISQYETGLRVPSDNVKRALANLYGTTVQELFFNP